MGLRRPWQDGRARQDEQGAPAGAIHCDQLRGAEVQYMLGSEDEEEGEGEEGEGEGEGAAAGQSKGKRPADGKGFDSAGKGKKPKKSS